MPTIAYVLLFVLVMSLLAVHPLSIRFSSYFQFKPFLSSQEMKSFAHIQALLVS